jgi:glycosyltransferase involved in cell wall biosynthesis
MDLKSQIQKLRSEFAMRVLQVCNVGNILGGTAACAWTVTRALPQVEHRVVFLSRITDETRRVFAPVEVEQWRNVDDAQSSRWRPHAVLLHNTPPARVGRIGSAVIVQYMHSAGARAAADVTVCCSRWLLDHSRRAADVSPLNGASPRPCDNPSATVLYQGVPKPVLTAEGDTRSLRERLIIGRICSPQAKKWPAELPEFYANLARRFPEVEWEFVGCPADIHSRLREACSGRATFHAASWSARARYRRWDALLYHNPHVTESFGRTVAESMRAGCIPIVDARGGFVEQVADGRGFLCSTADEFAAAVDRLHAAGERRRMSRAAMAHADEAFSLERFSREFMRLLSAVASAPEATSRLTGTRSTSPHSG